MENVKLVLSDTLLGLLFAWAIWGITSIQVATYYRKFKSDPLSLKVAVGVVWICGTMYVILEAAFLYNIIHGTWIKEYSVAAPVFAATVQSLVQAIYAIRLYRLCNQIWIPLICCAGAVYEFATAVAYDVLVLNATFFQSEKKYRWLKASQFITSPVVEVIITTTFCYLLLRDRRRINKRTLRIIDKLVVWTIHSGLITSVSAIVMVTIDFALSDPGPWLILAVMLPTLYPMTLISLLNARSRLRTMNEKANYEFSSFRFQTNQLPIGTNKALDLSTGTHTTEDLGELSKPPETAMEIATSV